MRSLLKCASMIGIASVTLIMTACNSQPNFDVTLDNGNQVAIESDYLQITNQEMFEFVAGGHVNWTNSGVSTILDWADYLILSELVTIDDVALQLEFENRFQDDADDNAGVLDDARLQERLIIEGFDNVDDYKANIRLQMMRDEFVADSVEISEEEILARFEEVFLAVDENELDEDTDELGEELPEPSLEDERAGIEDFLRSSVLQNPAFAQQTLATLRTTADLTIHSSYFATRYEDFLENWSVDDVNVISESNDSEIIASINGHDLTVDELFTTIVQRFAFGNNSQLLNHINLNTLNEIYADADPAVVRANLNQAKVNMNTWFFPQMEMRGLLTEQQIYDFFFLSHLQERAFDDNFSLTDEDVAELQANFPQTRNIQYILVDDYDVANEIIAVLQETDAEEISNVLFDYMIEHEGNFLDTLTAPPIDGMPEAFDDAAFALEMNEFTTTPVATENGYYIIFNSDISEIPSLSEIRQDETARLRESVQYMESLMINFRASQNLRFSDPQIQAQYDAVVEQNRRDIDDL